jgi:hypothetical protein
MHADISDWSSEAMYNGLLQPGEVSPLNAINSKPETLNPKSKTRDPKPEPETRNPNLRLVF